MFRRVIIVFVVGSVLLSLGSLAQNASTPPAPSTGSDQAQNPGNAPAPAASGTPVSATSNGQTPAASSPTAPTATNQAQTAKTTKKSTKASSKNGENAQIHRANGAVEQPLERLLDRAMDAMKHGKYDVA